MYHTPIVKNKLERSGFKSSTSATRSRRSQSACWCFIICPTSSSPPMS